MATLQHPFFGFGLHAFTERAGTIPHFLPATYAVAGGIAAGSTALYLYLRLLRAAVVGPQKNSPNAVLGASILSVYTVWGTLEPTGPFVGVALVCLLVVASHLKTDGDVDPE